jgi:hypothetical protein
MTGPEHYREAERLLNAAEKHGVGGAAGTLAAAQVHATLALAAVTALAADPDGMHIKDISAWNVAVGGAS